MTTPETPPTWAPVIVVNARGSLVCLGWSDRANTDRIYVYRHADGAERIGKYDQEYGYRWHVVDVPTLLRLHALVEATEQADKRGQEGRASIRAVVDRCVGGRA